MQFEEKMKTLVNEKTMQCYQCGICSGACPMRFAMDTSPMQIVRMVNLELEDKILSSNSMWICGACFSCQVKCPQGVNIPRIMEALRQMQLRKKKDHVHLKEIPRVEIRKIPQVALISNQRKLAA